MGKALVGFGLLLATVVMGMVMVVTVVMGGGSMLVGGTNGTDGAAGTATELGENPGSGGSSPGPAIPTDWATLYQQAADICPGLSWSVLAAIGTVESDSGQSTAPGVWSGANRAGAEGPMQFEPATFTMYATVGPQGTQPPSPYDRIDAVYTAAELLCVNGAGSATTLSGAIWSYNHATEYVDTVLILAMAIGDAPLITGTVVVALTFASRQLNTPYLWGGTGKGGFDCSGLTEAAFGIAGIGLPRVAQDQFDAGPPVPSSSAVAPGDLVFFGNSPSGVDHVGLYIGGGEMIDAPHQGALVRLDSANWPDFVGATRPGG